MQEGERAAVQALPILGQSSAAIEPGDGALDNPALRQRDELAQLASLDDLEVDLATGRAQPGLEVGALVSAIGVELQREG